jgi:hypothetical protein
MFSRRARLNSARKYTREFFRTLITDLADSGFDHINVVLPHNYVKLQESTVSVDALLEKDRNYPALILIAKDSGTGDTLKILFVNSNSKAVFADDTFPNAESEPPQIYYQSRDPGRTYAVFEFFREYLQQPSLGGYRLAWIAGNLSLLFLVFEAVFLATSKRPFLQAQLSWHPFFDLVFSALAIRFSFSFFSYPKGLWIKPEREIRLLYLANMAIRGDLRDNPLVSLIVSVLGTVIAALILHWFHLIP